MRLILKHLGRSIARRPTQPLILILTVILAVITSTFAFTIEDTIARENSSAQEALYGSSDFTVTLSGSSEERFMFADEAEQILGGGAAVEGCYELPLVFSGETALGVAVDFYGIDRIFKLEFTEYGSLNPATVATAAFISSSFAKEYGIALGDRLTFEFMGGSRVYTVEGITKNRMIGDHDVMVDISGVVRSMAESSPVFAALGDSFRPASTLYVSLPKDEHGNVTGFREIGEDGGWKDATSVAMERLAKDSSYSDKSFKDVRNAVIDETGTGTFDTIIAVAVALACLLSSVVTFCCFYILSSERSEENLALSYAGAGPIRLAAMQYTEAFIYWLIGAPAGAALSLPLTKVATSVIGLKYTVFTVTPSAVLKSVLIMLPVSLLTVAFLILTSRRTARTGRVRRTTFRWALVSLLFIALVMLLTPLFPPYRRFRAFMLVVAGVVTAIFTLIPPILELMASRIGRIRTREDGGTKGISLKYALKNLSSVKVMHNICRLTALAVTITMVTCATFASVKGVMRALSDMFRADYAVINATDRCYDAVSGCASAEKVYRVYSSSSLHARIIAADDLSVFTERLGIDEEPHGNVAVVASGFADMEGLKEGDSFSIDIGGNATELVIGKIAKSGINYVAFDAEHFSIPYNMLLVKGAEGVSDAQLLDELSEASASELAAVVKADTLLRGLYDTSTLYLNMGKILLGIFAAFSVIGIADVLFESTRARKGEFELYRLSGMEKKKVRRMRLFEILSSLLLGVLISTAATAVALAALDMGMTQFGYELFVNILSRK